MDLLWTLEMAHPVLQAHSCSPPYRLGDTVGAQGQEVTGDGEGEPTRDMVSYNHVNYVLRPLIYFLFSSTNDVL